MPWTPPAPVVASSLAELRGSLGVDDRLVGYEAIVDAMSDSLAGGAAQTCIRAARPADSGLVPSVLVVLDDAIWEGWLDGTTVVTAATARPGGEEVR